MIQKNNKQTFYNGLWKAKVERSSYRLLINYYSGFIFRFRPRSILPR